MKNLNTKDFRPEESLDSIFTRLIAKKDNITEQGVTVDYISQQREKLIYPNVRYEVGSTYGGYDHDGLLFLTQNELAAIGELISELMKELQAKNAV